MDIQQIGNLIGYPVYVFGRDWVEKHIASGGKVRHLFTREGAKPRCSCMGWMRFGDCRHLKMLRDDWSWMKEGGVVPDYVRAYLPDLEELSPGIAERFERRLATDAEVLGTVPEYIMQLSMLLPEAVPREIRMIVAVHTFADGRQLAVRLGNRGCVEGVEPV